jgi:hypothetical protein
MTYTTPIPGAGIYGQAIDSANLAYKNALGRLNQQRSGALRQFGYAGDIDPESGTLTNTHVDGGNQFGAFQEMLRSGAEQANSVRDQLIERRLGSGGLAAQSEDQLKQDFGRNSASLGQQLIDTLGGFQDSQNQASYTRDQALYQAQLDAARNSVDNGDFNPADPGGSKPPGDAPRGSSDRRVSPLGPIDPWAVGIFGKSGQSTGPKPKIRRPRRRRPRYSRRDG